LPPDHPLTLVRNEIAKERTEVEALKVKISIFKLQNPDSENNNDENDENNSVGLSGEVLELQNELKEAQEKLKKRKKKLIDIQNEEIQVQKELQQIIVEDYENKYQKSANALSRGLLCLRQREEGMNAGVKWAEVEATHYDTLSRSKWSRIQHNDDRNSDGGGDDEQRDEGDVGLNPRHNGYSVASVGQRHHITSPSHLGSSNHLHDFDDGIDSIENDIANRLSLNYGRDDGHNDSDVVPHREELETSEEVGFQTESPMDQFRIGEDHQFSDHQFQVHYVQPDHLENEDDEHSTPSLSITGSPQRMSSRSERGIAGGHSHLRGSVSPISSPQRRNQPLM